MSVYVLDVEKLQELEEKLPYVKTVNLADVRAGLSGVLKALNSLKKTVGVVGFSRGGLAARVELTIESFYGHAEFLDRITSEYGDDASLSEPVHDEAAERAGFSAPVIERL